MKNTEFISKKKQKILKKEFIEDVWEALQNTNLRFVTFYMKMDAIEKMYFKKGGGSTFNNVTIGNPWFSLIKQGKKIVEGRLNKGRFAKMRKGDIVEWLNPKKQERFKVVVTEKQVYSTFKEMIEGEGLDKVLPGISSIDEGVKVYKKYFSDEDERRFGVVAVRMEITNSG